MEGRSKKKKKKDKKKKKLRTHGETYDAQLDSLRNHLFRDNQDRKLSDEPDVIEAQNDSDEEVDILAQINASLDQFAIFCFLERKTDMEKSDFLFLGIFIITTILFMAAGFRSLCNMVAFIVPAYRSYKALQDREAIEKQVDPLHSEMTPQKGKTQSRLSPSEAGLKEAEITLLELDVETMAEIVHCLRYWVVFASFLVLEFIGDILLACPMRVCSSGTDDSALHSYYLLFQ
jgi:hypothetical protein